MASTEPTVHPSSTNPPPLIAAAHLYMLAPTFAWSPNGTWNDVPVSVWSQINFRVVDILYVSPFIVVMPGGTFGLDNPPARREGTGDLWNRFNWVVKTARDQNPKIKIVVQQFWGGRDLQELQDDKGNISEDKIKKYTLSVQKFIKENSLDGYDLDYEVRKDGGPGNVVKEAPEVLKTIRLLLNALGRPCLLSISAATTHYLNNTVKDSLHHVNMQTYAGGFHLSPEDFTSPTSNPPLQLEASQLLYGIWPENTDPLQSHQLDNVLTVRENEKLGGIHLWRLNSYPPNNLIFENKVQMLIYDELHGSNSPGYKKEDVRSEWNSGIWNGNNGDEVNWKGNPKWPSKG